MKHLLQDRFDVDLILTDVVMPGLNGRELVEKLRAGHPELQAIFMSGYTNDIIDGDGIREQGSHYLQKPFTLPRLTTKVREVLDRRVEVRRRTP